MKPDSLPLSQIFQSWPDLVELKIIGAKNFRQRNYDDELCGTNEEEAERLRRMNIEFLQNAQILPVKPSLVSMTSKDDILNRNPLAGENH